MNKCNFPKYVHLFLAGKVFGLLLLISATKKVWASIAPSDSSLPNILLITSEDNSIDFGCYGSRVVKTPNFDSLASVGVKFENAYTSYSVCSPSRSTLLTGLYPHQNGQIGLATHHFSMFTGIKSLPVYLKEAGYRTGCIGKIHVNPESSIPFDFRPPKGSHLLKGNFGRRNLNLYNLLAEQFFNVSDIPFFLMINYPDAHTPWKRQVNGLPEHPLDSGSVLEPLSVIGANSSRLRQLTADYYNSIERLDAMVGDLIHRLNASKNGKNTVIIYIADHGPEFSRGKFSLYNLGLQVPLIVYWPEETALRGSSKKIVSNIDILPTILEAAHIDIPGSLPGASLKSRLASQDDNSSEFVYAETGCSFPFDYYPGDCVFNRKFKLIHNFLSERENPVYDFYTDHEIEGFEGGNTKEEIADLSPTFQRAYQVWRQPTEYELYDLEHDPYELHNLVTDPRYNLVRFELLHQLTQWDKETRNPFSDPALLGRFTKEVDAVIEAHPKMDDARDKSIHWKYLEYFQEFIHNK